MNFFHNTSIQRKQTLIIMATTSVALLLVCAALTVFEILSFRQKMTADLATYASIAGNNVSAALDFNDSSAAEETLSALKAKPDIIGACVYSPDGNIFAQYSREGTVFTPPKKAQQQGFVFGKGSLSLFQPIKSGNQVIGVIYLQSDTQNLRSQLTQYATIILIVFIVTLFISLVLSNWLQRLISEPILDLVRTAREVAQSKNYSMRVRRRSTDEIGVLIDNFNDMLAQIQERDTNLEKHVQERTQELAKSISILNATLDSTTDGILVVNPERKKVLQNRQAMQLWKLPQPVSEETGDENRLRWVASLTKKPDEFLAKVEHLYSQPDAKSHDEVELKDGTIIERITGPVLGDDGKNYGRIWTFRDITERKRAEAALAYERELLNSLLNNSDDKIYFKDLESRFIRCSRSMARLFGLEKPEDLNGKKDSDFFSGEHAQEAFADEQEIIRTGQPLLNKTEKETWPDGRVTWVLTTKMPLRNSAGEIAGTFGISKDITAIKLAEAELNRERNLLSAIINNSPDNIYIKDTAGRKVMANPAEVKLMGFQKEAEAVGKTDFDVFPQDLATQYFADDQKVIQQGQMIINREEKVISPNGAACWLLSSKIPLRDADGKIIGLVGMGRDITAMKEAETKLDQAHKQLLETSRQAGMAEVATSVLHNVGNVLNSANVSTSLIADKMRNSKIPNVGKVAALIREHEKDLGTFIMNDPKGKQLPDYLSKLAEHLGREQDDVLREINSLVSNIVHIKEIVAMQQSYAKASGVLESFNVAELIEDAMRMNSGAVSRHNIKVVRELDGAGAIVTDKHKVLQILVNLIRNAKYACDDSGRGDKQITLRAMAADGRVKISVIDNGIGIVAENLTRIFNHGFTTRKDGHGFGLHSGANAARELGGTLTAFSEGLGRGAAFTLDLPATQTQNNHEH